MPPSDNSPEKDWFNSIPNPELPQQPGSVQPQGSSHKKWFILLPLAILLIIGGCVAAFSFLATPSSTAQCLSPDDYKTISNASSSDQPPASGIFYTASIQSSNNTSDYSNPAEVNQIINKIADFYKIHPTVTITITSDYTPNDSEEAAESRSAKLESALVQRGVDQASISVQPHTFLNTDGELSPDSEELTSATSYLSISSNQECKQ